MKARHKHTWKKRWGSILLCLCILVNSVQISVPASAEEQAAVLQEEIAAENLISNTASAASDTEASAQVDTEAPVTEPAVADTEAPATEPAVADTEAPVSESETSSMEDSVPETTETVSPETDAVTAEDPDAGNEDSIIIGVETIESDTEEEEIIFDEVSDNLTAEEVRNRINALPDVSELETMDEESRDQVYMEAQDAYDSYDSLTEEQQTELSAEWNKLLAILEYFANQTGSMEADSSAYAPTRIENYLGGKPCIFANGTPITIEEGTNGTVIWYMNGSTKTYVTNNGSQGEDLSNAYIFAGSNNSDGMKSNVNASITMTGGTVNYIWAGQSSGFLKGTSTITITGGNILNGIQNSGVTGNTTYYAKTVNIYDAVGVGYSSKGGTINALCKNGITWTVTGSPKVPSDVIMEIDKTETLTIPKGSTLTINGRLNVYGTLTCSSGAAIDNEKLMVLYNTATVTFASGCTVTNNAEFYNNAAMVSGSGTIINDVVMECNKHSTSGNYVPTGDGDDRHCCACYFNGIHTVDLEDYYDSYDVCTFDAYGFCTVCGGYKKPDLSNGVYQIKLPGHLFWFADRVNAGENTISATLCNDIDLNADGKSRNWVSIGTSTYKYSGTFNGGDHTISNFYQNITVSGKYGLFAYAQSATIKNFSINGNAYMNCTENDAGTDFAVVAQATVSGTVHCYLQNIYSSINLTVQDSVTKGELGGIAGYAAGGDSAASDGNWYRVYITKCSYSGTLDYGSAYVDCGAGIAAYVGYGSATYIEDCLFDGKIIHNYSSGRQIGGIVGYYRGKNIRINDCEVAGTLQLANTSNAGAIAGLIRQMTTSNIYKIANNYYDENCGLSTPFYNNGSDTINTYDNYNTTTIHATGVSTEELASGLVAFKLNNSKNNGWWKQTIGTDAYAKFSGSTVYGLVGDVATLATNDSDLISKNSSGYYQIYRANQLVMFQQFVDVGNRYACGILMEDIYMRELDYDWTAICSTDLYYNSTSYENYYTGTFDGNYHVIHNLSVTAVSGLKRSYGLFGTIYDTGTIKNLGIEYFSFNTNSASDIRAGAIVGQILPGGTVSNCYVTGADINPGTYVAGGLAGCNYAGTIENCHVYDSYVKATTNRTGMIVGDNHADGSSTDRVGTVRNCYATSCTGSTTIVGANKTGTVENCAMKDFPAFASGEVTWRLNGCVNYGSPWKQGDTYPCFSGRSIYYIEGATTPSQDSNGVYLIYTVADMLGFAQVVNNGETAAKGKMMNDIDMTSITSWGVGTTTYPFAGEFDGGGYTLTIDLKGSQDVAPFPRVAGASIHDLVVQGSATIAKDDNGNGKFAAGIVGIIEANCSTTTTLTNCLVEDFNIDSSTSGDGTHGGLVAVANSSLNAVNCGFSGYFNGSSTTHCGGLVGWSNTYVTLKNCYVYTSLKQSSAALFDNTTGCDVFSRNQKYVTIDNCYYYCATVGCTGYKSGTPVSKTAEQFKSGEVCWLLNGGNNSGTGTWKQQVNSDKYPTLNSSYNVYYGMAKCDYGKVREYSNSSSVTVITDHDGTYENGFCTQCGTYQSCSGSGTSASPYEIGNAGQLYWFACVVNGFASGFKGVTATRNQSAYGKLTADITVNENVLVDGALTNDTDSLRIWSPIGRGSYQFKGNFDGDGHSISGLYFSDSETDVGLFGSISPSGRTVVQNLTVKDSYFYGMNAVGGISGYTKNCTISNCGVEDSLIVSKNMAGGIAGTSYGAVYIEECWNGATIQTTYAGGIIGMLSSGGNSRISNCYHYGTTSGSSSGAIASSVSNGNTVSNCYSYEYNKKLVNSLNGTITNCYYLADSETDSISGTTYKTADQFAYGEVTWLLNGETADGDLVWHQDLDYDNYPLLTGDQVVYCGYWKCTETEVSYANTELSVDRPHAYTKDPTFSWSEDCTSCEATFHCDVAFYDPDHDTVDTCTVEAVITEDKKATVYTATVTRNGATYTDSQTLPNRVISADVTWTAMVFEYTVGDWNPNELRYETGTWTPTSEDGGQVTVENTGTVMLDVTLTYGQANESGVAVSFVPMSENSSEAGEASGECFTLDPDASRTIQIKLQNEPPAGIKKTQIGSVTISIAQHTEGDETVYAGTEITIDSSCTVNEDYSGKATVAESEQFGIYGTYKNTQYAARIVSVDVAWTSMSFQYAASQQGTWDPETHSYTDANDEPQWLSDTATITLTNHSNVGVTGSLGYTPSAQAVTGTLSNTEVELDTAEGAGSAPSDSVTFQVGGTLGEDETSLGTITVAVEAVDVPVCLDLSGITSDTEQSEYNTAIAEWLEEIDPDKKGGVTLNVKLPATSFSKMGNKICDALYEYYDQDMDTKVDLVCYGTTTITGNTWYQSGCNVNSIRFPEATTMMNQPFTGLGSGVTAITLDKITSIPTMAFNKCYGLTSLTFGSVITEVSYSSSGWIVQDSSGTSSEDITLYLNSAQKSAQYGYYSTTEPKWGESGSFGGYTFAKVVALP